MRVALSLSARFRRMPAFVLLGALLIAAPELQRQTALAGPVNVQEARPVVDPAIASLSGAFSLTGLQQESLVRVMGRLGPLPQIPSIGLSAAQATQLVQPAVLSYGQGLVQKAATALAPGEGPKAQAFALTTVAQELEDLSALAVVVPPDMRRDLGRSHEAVAQSIAVQNAALSHDIAQKIAAVRQAWADKTGVDSFPAGQPVAADGLSSSAHPATQLSRPTLRVVAQTPTQVPALPADEAVPEPTAWAREASDLLVRAEAILRESKWAAYFPNPNSGRDDAHRHGVDELRQSIFQRMREKLSAPDYLEFERWYESHFFYDRNLLLLDNLHSNSRRMGPAQAYDRWGERSFDGYLEAKHSLFQSNPGELTVENISRTHYQLLSKKSIREGFWAVLFRDWWLKRNSEGTQTKDLGAIRDQQVGYEDSSHIIQSWSLSRLATKGSFSQSPETYTQLAGQNPLIKKTDSSFVEYAPLSEWRRYKKRLSRETRARLYALEKKRSSDLNTDAGEVKEVRRRVIAELLQQEMSDLRVSLEAVKSNDDVIKAVGRFHHQFVSIHPFINGNGRTARLITEFLLNKYGIPPPLWTFSGEDVVLSVSDFTDLLKDSIALSRKFHEELDALTKAGIDYQFVSAPYLTPNLGADKVAGLVPEEFMTWIAASNRVVAGKGDNHQLTDAILDFFRWKKGFAYKIFGDSHSKMEDGIRLVTPLFSATFAKLSATREVFQIKMKHFYNPEQTLYRGLALLDSPSDREMIEHFIRLTDATAGMGVSPQTDPATFSGIFDAYNVELARSPKALRKRLRNHAAANSGYWNSKFISMTTSRQVALRFARGFLMPRDHKLNTKATLEIQAMDRTQGAVKNERYTEGISAQGVGREAEVVLLGGVDPEAVTRVVVEDVEVKLLYGRHSWLDPSGTYLQIEYPKIKKRRVARRIDFNRVELRETTGAGGELWESKRVAIYEIGPDGSVRIVSQENH